MRYSLFAGIDQEPIDKLIAGGVRSFYKAKDIVFSQGDDGHLLYLIEDGHVSVKMELATGDALNMQVLGPGYYFGEVALLSEPPTRHVTVRAINDMTVVKIRRADFEDFRQRHPRLNDTLLANLATTVRLLYAQLAEVSSENVEVRLMHRLLEVAEVFGRGPTTAETVIPLTQQDVADLVGTSRPTASTILQGAQKRGLVKLDRGRVTIIDPEKLRKR